MNVVMLPLAKIRPYPGNPRHNEQAIAAVARSIEEYGFCQPIVLDTQGVIIVGDTRFKAAQRLDLAEVPVYIAAGLSPAQAKAYRLADNKTAELATWNEELLLQELLDLERLNFDLDLTGFAADELAQLMAADPQEGLTDPDEIPAPPDASITQAGDLYKLGDHSLLCGDAASAADLDKLLNGAPIHLVVSDPPYNVQVEPRSNNAIAAGLSSFTTTNHQKDVSRHPAKGKATHKKLRAKDRPLANDFLPDADFEKLLHAWFGNLARALLPGRSFYLWGGYTNCANYPSALKACHLYFSQAIIWVKEHPVLTRKDYMGNHEWGFYGWKEGAGHEFYGPNNAVDVWSIKKINPQNMVHLTEKPVELAARAMQYSSRPGENVLDLFGGSGSTLIAAEQSKRHAFVMEIDPLYCDVIVERWQKFTGRQAKRENTSPEGA
jgi:DNA modification methylase